MKTIKIGGEYFGLSVSNTHNVAPIIGYNRNEIFDIYKSPSVTKVKIWNDWCNWCRRVQDSGYECGIEIAGYNTSTFTIVGSLRKGNDMFDIKITKSYNRIYAHNKKRVIEW